ncbi:hypothetical protein GQ457_11G007870 [Hibiscus cannabinus]
MAGFAADSECWKENVQGNFTVKSAYVIQCGPTAPDDGKLWKTLHSIGDCSQRCLLASSSTASSLVLSVHTGSAVRSSNDVQRLLAEGWFHANSDAGCRIADGSATCGGVIRNHDGHWVQEVAKFIGICSALEAELWGAYITLHAMRGLGITQIVIELDCLEDVRMIQLAFLPPGTPTIMLHLRELLSRTWCVEVYHIARERNRLAHDIAKLANGPSLCPIYFSYPPYPIIISIMLMFSDNC